jgi:hypothetical protein
MQARVVYFDGCPNWRVAGERLRLALHRLGRFRVPISWVRVETEEEATTAGFAGSPTTVIDDDALFPSAGAWTGGLARRLHWTSTGPSKAPSVDDLVAALSEKADGS